MNSKLYSVRKSMRLLDTKKSTETRPVYREQWSILGNDLSWKDAKDLRKNNPGSALFPALDDSQISIIEIGEPETVESETIEENVEETEPVEA